MTKTRTAARSSVWNVARYSGATAAPAIAISASPGMPTARSRAIESSGTGSRAWATPLRTATPASHPAGWAETTGPSPAPRAALASAEESVPTTTASATKAGTTSGHRGPSRRARRSAARVPAPTNTANATIPSTVGRPLNAWINAPSAESHAASARMTSESGPSSTREGDLCTAKPAPGRSAPALAVAPVTTSPAHHEVARRLPRPVETGAPGSESGATCTGGVFDAIWPTGEDERLATGALETVKVGDVCGRIAARHDDNRRSRLCESGDPSHDITEGCEGVRRSACEQVERSRRLSRSFGNGKPGDPVAAALKTGRCHAERDAFEAE